MPKAKTYQEIRDFIVLKNRELVTTENEFYKIKIENRMLPSQINLQVKCDCTRVFTVTFNQFRSNDKHSCNECGVSILKERIYPQERINSVIDMYNAGMKMVDIKKSLKMKVITVSEILKKNNVKIRNNTEYKTSVELATSRKYIFDTDYFEVINT